MAFQLTIRDVTLRDGLQDESVISTDDKLTLFDALTVAGVPELELTSFVRPDRVPAMADAERITAATSGASLVRWGLVLNLRGAQRALAAGLRHLQFVVSVSEQHNRGNASRTVAESIDDLAAIVTMAREFDAVTEVTLATAFGCPHVGAVPSALVRRVVDGVLGAGARNVALADTIGTAVPTEVADLVRAMVADHPNVAVGVHLHDTRGLAISNALAAIDSGAVRVDGSVGGLGGCPFAPGASGNLVLEDLVHALEHMGIRTGIDLDLLTEAGRLACQVVGRNNASHVETAGARFAQLMPPAD